MANLFDDIEVSGGAERFDELFARPGAVIERIVSTGQVTPADAPYDQAWDEWILLVSGAARLWVDGRGEVALTPGDHLLIPAHCRHRVLWTQADPPTVWVAVHFK